MRAWLIAVAALIALMVLVGGATRLTESGLSIVEWKPVTGALPPLTEAQWHDAFEGYKKIPQYRELNAGMSLAEFKTIFWWEWSHRLLGRFIGVVFLLPFLCFLWRGVLGAELKRRLWLIFGLGALQGAVGWWMVASGLSRARRGLAISPGRASGAGADHLCRDRLDAAADARIGRGSLRRARLKITSPSCWRVTFLQIYFGALVAGLRAGRVYNTWPISTARSFPPPSGCSSRRRGGAICSTIR